MKKVSMIIAFVFTIYSSFSAEGFDITPLGMNFNGVIVSGSNIIAYSDAGSYLMTTDKGLNWKQYKISETGNIKMLLNYNDTLWGIIDKGILIRSADFGLHWDKYNIGLEEGDTLKYITLSDDYIFLRASQTIMRYDKNIMFINSYSDSSLFCDKTDETGRQMFSFMKYVDNQLLVSVSNVVYDRDGKIMVLNDELEQINLIEINDYLPDPEYRYYENMGNELTDILNYKNRNVYIINSLPYYAENNFTEWTYIFPELTTGRAKTSEPNTTHLLNTYYEHNDNLYYGLGVFNEKMQTIPSSYLLTERVLYTVGILKYNSDLDTFKLNGNFFDNSYYSLGSFTDGISQKLWNGKYAIMDDSIFVWVGNDKTLLQSRDACKTWELVSYASEDLVPRYILNDSVYYCYRPYYYEFYSTFDGGQAFLPVKIDTGGHYPYFPCLSEPMTMYMDSMGRGFITAAKFGNTILNGRRDNFAFTSDSGKSYSFYSIDSLMARENKSTYSNILNDATDVMFSINNPDSCSLYVLNLETNDERLISRDYYYSTEHILADNFQVLLLFQTNYMPDGDSTTSRFEVNSSNDSGRTKSLICSIDNEINIEHIYEHNKDSVFFTSRSPNRIFLFDRHRNCFDTLFSDDSRDYNFLSLMCISDKFFIVGDSLFLENSNRNNLTQWSEGYWDYGIPSFSSVLFKGNIALAKFKDSIRAANYYKLTLNTGSTDVIDEHTESPIQHFFAAKPFPSPADNVANVRIYWDGPFDAESADKYVCDVYGTILKDNGHVYVNYQQAYEAELSWECSHVTSGLYFIVIDHNGTLRNIPVLVVK